MMITYCRNCKNELEFIPSFKHECVEDNTEVTHDVFKCPLCEALHYKEGVYDVFEFFPKKDNFIFVPQVNDDQIHLIKDKV